jgi:predicted  nucleic acid-binding Zn-ribbon protein
METIRSTFQDVKAEREALAGRVDPEVLQRYMAMLAKKQEAVVVPIRQESCGGCHMKLSPQILHDAHSGQKWTSCGFCGRMLYDPAV